MGERVLVSACLLGRACRYDGRSKPSDAVANAVAGAEVLPVCPEELGDLGTPRPPAWLVGGDGAAVLAGRARVERHDGTDVTAAFVRGAQAAAQPTDRAILKARSPSCGVGATWIDGAVCAGDGVFAALLRARGVPLYSDEEL